MMKLKIDYQDFMIFFTFFLFWISIQFGQIVEDSIAYGIVLSLGIIHGSNDFTILKRIENNRNNFLKTTLYYLFLMLACVVSYLINPFISILLFVFLSAYHFGEQHLESKFIASKFIKLLIYVLYGVLIFSLIFIENLKDVDAIMMNLTGSVFPEDWIYAALIFSFFLLILFYAYSKISKQKSTIHIVRELFYLILLYLVFKTSSLIFGFAVYFVLWHSVPSILDQTKFLSGEKNTTTIIAYLKTAFFYWLISIAGLLIAFYYFKESTFNSVIFLVLFAVTAPHVWVMNRMKR